jgi:hypothetical protein
MLRWLRRWRERAERVDAKVEALTRAFGVDAHCCPQCRELFVHEIQHFRTATSTSGLSQGS